MAEKTTTASSPQVGHELSDLNPKYMAIFGAVLAGVIIVVVLITYALFHYFFKAENRARPLPSPLSYSAEPTPQPRLSVDPGAELQSLRAEEDQALKTYGWIDPDRGLVRVPIDRVIDLLAQKGLPARSAKTEESDVRKEKVKGGTKR
jgi:hypothetical protein